MGTQVGVVTPYSAQVKLVRTLLAHAGLPTSREKGGVETNSVDGYQGREKEAIVMCTVRSSSSGGLGFVADWRRVNVAFTRARCGLIVIGDPETLCREPTTWAPWLQWVRRCGCCKSRSLDNLPDTRGKLEPVGLSVQDGADPVKLLDASSKSWQKGEGESEYLAPEEPSGDEDSCSESRKRKSSDESEDEKKKKKKKEKKKEKKKDKKKSKKKEKKKMKKLKKLLKKKKDDSSSIDTSVSSPSSSS